jgi:hypothetical protein
LHKTATTVQPLLVEQAAALVVVAAGVKVVVWRNLELTAQAQVQALVAHREKQLPGSGQFNYHLWEWESFKNYRLVRVH